MEPDTISDIDETFGKLLVCLRLKPRALNDDTEPILAIDSSSSNKIILRDNKESTFSKVFQESTTQLDLYEDAVFPLVENTLGGHDALFFTMGSSGSGKSHTTFGDNTIPGMVHLAIDTLFRSTQHSPASFEQVEHLCNRRPDRYSSPYESNQLFNRQNQPVQSTFPESCFCQKRVQADPDCKYAIYIYITEIYNDKVYDLLDDTSSSSKRRPLSLKANPYTKEIYPSNVQKVYVASMEEAIQVLNTGLKARISHSTGCNETSSRSHAVITLEVKRVVESMDEVFVSKLTIADLAGNERNKLSKTEGSRFQESCAINKSLMLLGQCLQIQKEDDKKRSATTESSVFRSSKLNQLLLANAFRSGNSQKSVMLVAMDPYGDLNSASQVLRYSATAREIPDNKPDNFHSCLMMNQHFNTGYGDRYGYPNNSDTASPANLHIEGREIEMGVTGSNQQAATSRASSASSQKSSRSTETLNADSEEALRHNIRTLLSTSSSNRSVKSGETQLVLAYIQELESKVSSLNQKCLDIEWEVRAELAEEQELAIQEEVLRQQNKRSREEVKTQRLANAKIDILRRTVYEPQIEELSRKYSDLERHYESLEQETYQYRRQNEVLQEIIRQSGLMEQLQTNPCSVLKDTLENSGSDIPSTEANYLLNLLRNSGI